VKQTVLQDPIVHGQTIHGVQEMVLSQTGAKVRQDGVTRQHLHQKIVGNMTLIQLLAVQQTDVCGNLMIGQVVKLTGALVVGIIVMKQHVTQPRHADGEQTHGVAGVTINLVVVGAYQHKIHVKLQEIVSGTSTTLGAHVKHYVGIVV